MIVADTDVLIDFLRGRGAAARRVALELETRAFATTAITAFELRSGARTAGQRRTIDALLDAMTVLSFGPEDAQIAADLRRRLEDEGQKIGMADYMIAAVCVGNGGVLLTRNRKHFERIQELKLSHLASG